MTQFRLESHGNPVSLEQPVFLFTCALLDSPHDETSNLEHPASNNGAWAFVALLARTGDPSAHLEINVYVMLDGVILVRPFHLSRRISDGPH